MSRRVLNGFVEIRPTTRLAQALSREDGTARHGKPVDSHDRNRVLNDWVDLSETVRDGPAHQCAYEVLVTREQSDAAHAVLEVGAREEPNRMRRKRLRFSDDSSSLPTRASCGPLTPRERAERYPGVPAELCRPVRVVVTELTSMEQMQPATAWLRATYPDALAVRPDPA